MKVPINRTETGTKVQAKSANRHARIVGVVTRCQPDGFSLRLYEALPAGDVPRAYCHIPAFRVVEHTAQLQEAAASRWLLEGVIVPACQLQPLG